MTKLLAILAGAMLLTACYQVVSLNDWEVGQAICEKNGSTILEVQADAVGREYVGCKNRMYFAITTNKAAIRR